MVKKIFSIIFVALPAICFAGKYTPQMYEKALVPDTVFQTVTVHDTIYVHDTVRIEAPAPVVDTTTMNKPVTVEIAEVTAPEESAAAVESAPASAGNTYKDESGKALKQQFHIVIGSFQSKLNAQNLLDQVMQKGEGSPSIAISSDGKYRVFYFSSDSEEEARRTLSQVKEEYPSAWLLNLNK